MGLQIGIDATCLSSRRGYGRFLRELLPPLVAGDADNSYFLFADAHASGALAGLAELPVRWVRIDTREDQAEAASARGKRRLGDLWRMGRAVARVGLDVMYFPSVYSYFPVPGKVPVVVAFHDTIPERYGALVFPTHLNRWLWNIKVRLARRRASAIVTVSDWAGRCLAEEFGISPDRIYVTVEAPSPIFQPSQDAPSQDAQERQAWLRDRGIPERAPYLIYVGGFNPHKNLVALIEAFDRVRRESQRGDLHLVLVGDTEGDNFHIDVGALRDAMARTGTEACVHLPGFVPDETLRHLYSGALALAIPSLEEGFGLPAVEAAACGTPCIATRNSPLPELLEGGGLFVDPVDPDALCHAIMRIIQDQALRQQLGAGALMRARALSWQATADATRRALEAVARNPS